MIDVRDEWTARKNEEIARLRKEVEELNSDRQVLLAQLETMSAYGGTISAPEILERAAGHMADRVKTYDAAGGERSMGKVSGMIRTLYADQLARGEFTEEMAWGLQVVLKLVRTSQGGYRADNYEDGAAYFALMGECASVEREASQ